MTDPTPSDPAQQYPKATDPTSVGDPPKQDPPKNDPAKPDEPLGEGGKKALQDEREARKELEKQLKALSPLQKLAEMFGDGDPAKGKSEIEQLNERISKHESELSSERQARWRAEVANEKGLTAAQAARLVGDTREALTADADELLEVFKPAEDQQNGSRPKPDPSQGSRGSVDLDAQIAEAEKSGDVRTSIRLKNQKAMAARATSQ